VSAPKSPIIMSVSLLPVILSSPNDPIITLSWIGPAVSEVLKEVESVVTAVLVLFGASVLSIDIPGVVVAVGGCKDSCNPCRSF
jgi:hypothetical protein